MFNDVGASYGTGYGTGYGSYQHNHNPNAQYMQALQMNQMSAMGLLTGNSVVNGAFFYKGNTPGLEGKLQQIKKTGTIVNNATINVTGSQVKEGNACCCFLTVCCGTFLIFPYCFVCCSWWKKIVSPAYSIPHQTYRALQQLFNNSNIVNVTLIVNDNTFDQTKAKILYDILSRSPVKGFTFTNLASSVDYQLNQYSNFKQNMIPIKSLPIVSQIRWNSEIVL